jgi:endonuclease YncB( thermonuclease family)
MTHTWFGCRLLFQLFIGSLFLSSWANAEGAEWLALKDCRYLPNASNDGDSFHVRAGNREYIFRLYFVDSPETDDSIPERVREQGKYFHVTTSEVLKIGLEAERFTRQQLMRPFTVRTCLQDARGRSRLPRYFAFIESNGADLGERLVANGLARVFGAASEAPGMKSPEAEWRRLEELERKAKQERVGGWGIAFGRLRARAATQPGVGPDYFESFFHPNRETTAATTQPTRTRLDINTATTEQLQDLPGIGRVLAERIIASRPFRSADDLQRVKGIKSKKYEQLRPYFE